MDDNKSEGRDITRRSKAEAALHAAEVTARHIFEALPIGIHMYRLEPDGRLVFTSANAAADRILRVDNTVFIGKTIEDAFPLLKTTEMPQRYREVAATGITWHTEQIEYHEGAINGAFVVHAFQTAPNTMAAAFEDITTRKQSEAALRQSEEKYRRLYNETPVLLHSIDMDGIMVEVNDYWLQTLGYDRSEVLGKKVTDFYTEASRRHFHEVVRPTFLREGMVRDIPYQLIRKNGKLVDVLLSATAERDTDGNIVRSQAVIIDITERKQAEQLLLQREARYRMLYEGTPVMLHSIDAEGKLISVSDHWLSTLGYTRDEVLGRRSTEFLNDESRIYARDVVLPDFMRTGICTDIPYTFIKKNGDSIFTLLSAIAEHDEAGKVVRSLAVIIDITEQKRTEEALRRSEAQFRGLVEESPIAILIIDRSGRIEYTNKKHQEIVGYTVDQVPNLDAWWALAYPDAETRQRTMAAWGDLSNKILSGENVGPIERTIVCKDGTSKDVEMRFSLAGDKIYVVFVDITERKQTEERLRESEQKYRDLFESSTDALFILDLDGHFIDINKTAYTRLGYTKAEMLALHISRLDPPEFAARVPERLALIRRQGMAVFESAHLRKDGSVMPVEINSRLLNYEGRQVYFSVIRDITERKRLEQELIRTQKLESLGTLAGGIAHDFNNLLQGIFGYISLARMTIEQKDKALAMLDQAERALHQSVNLTTQLLTFSKGGKPLKKVFSLRPMIEDAVRFSLSGSRVDHMLLVDNDIRPVDADEGQLEQVIQNIVLNAEQAMPLGGRIEISARNIAASMVAGLPDELRGDLVEITVRDQGTGIPPEHLPRIFDPYFTTKEKGSGLGLATAYSIIRNHGGVIQVSSELGKGSAFTLYLPASDASLVQALPSKELTAGRRGRILVMDDDKFVREVAGGLIHSLGHEVALSEHGESAIAQYCAARAAGRPFDMVVLDLTIRDGMGGMETLQKMLEIDPQVKAVVSSGYSDDASMADHLSRGFKGCLKKPYNRDDLRCILNDMLALE